MSVATDHRTEVTIAAPPAEVFASLADAGGLRRWWSTAAENEPGGHIRLRWSVTDHLLIRVERAVEPSEIDWRFVAQRDHNLPRADEWVGTRATFRLSPDGDGATRLVLTHFGLPPLDCGEVCSRGWDGFLRGSLKPLLEGGAGAPWEPRP